MVNFSQMKATIKGLFKRLFDPNIVSRDSYSLVLVMFNSALLMHFKLRADWLIFLSIVLLFFNFRLWAVSLFQIGIALILALRVFPRQANHANIEVFIGAVIVMVFALKFFRVKLNVTPSLMSYIFRIVTVLMYFYAGFHKLNTDFFDTSVSCVNSFGAEKWSIFLGFFELQSHALHLSSIFLVYLTIFVEMIVPFGLFWHKSRIISVIVLLCFHVYLGFFSLANFSAFSIFLLIGSSINFSQKLTPSQILGARIYMICVMLYGIRYFAVGLIAPGFDMHGRIVELSAIIFAICSITFFCLFFKESKIAPTNFKRNYLPILILVGFLTSAWALKNYVGLGSFGNFTMFSNLVTEKSRNNHLFVDTKRTKIWGFEEDYVRLVELDSNLTWQKQNSKDIKNTLIPVIEFSYFIKKWSSGYSGRISCTLIYKGRKLTFKDLRASRFSEYHWWYHFIPFRIIQLEGPNKCRW